MTILFIDGFDHYASADFSKKYSTGGSGAINSSAGRRSTGALVSAGGTATVKPLGASYATLICGAAVSFANVATVTTFMGFQDSGTAQIAVRLTTGAQLAVERNGTVVGTPSVNTLSSGTYYYIEFKVTISDAAGVYEIKVNGVSWVSGSSADTKNTANASANEFIIRGSASNTTTFDDVYVANTSGSAPVNDFLGDCRVDTLLPTADGTYTQFTPSTGTSHYQLVDETTPNTSDYNSSSTAGHKDSYGMQDLSVLTGTIYAIQTSGAVLKDDAGARSIKVGVRSSSTDSVDAGTALSTSQLYYSKISETDPATAAAWTEAGVNAAEALFEVV